MRTERSPNWATSPQKAALNFHSCFIPFLIGFCFRLSRTNLHITQSHDEYPFKGFVWLQTLSNRDIPAAVAVPASVSWCRLAYVERKIAETLCDTDFRHKKRRLLMFRWCEGRTQTCDLTSWFKIVNNKQHHPIPTQIPTRKITGFRHRTRTIRSWLRYRALLLVICLDRLHCIKWYSHHRDRSNPDKSIFPIYIG